MSSIVGITRRVIIGEVSKRDAAKEIHETYGENEASASMNIDVIRCFLKGTTYKIGIGKGFVEEVLKVIFASEDTTEMTTAMDALRLHIDYQETKKGGRKESLREVLAAFELRLAGYMNAKMLPSLTKIVEGDETGSKHAAGLSDADLLKLANEARDGPAETVIATTLVRKRNAAVKEYTLRRAKGICERCGCAAPFRTDNGKPFLEVHHKQPLSMDGPDTIENTVALCPNCHREAHFGKMRGEMF